MSSISKTPPKHTRIYQKNSDTPFKISRSKIDMFLDCPRCFYLEARHGLKRPSTPPFTLNVAVDTLLKQEFDAHRAKGRKHPLQKKYKIDCLPVAHQNLNQWRHNFTGVQYLHPQTNFLVFGAIDDLWQDSKGKFVVVDYKATAKKEIVTELKEGGWHDHYRKQMEVYQWLLRHNGLKVSDTGYFVYCTGRPDKRAFDAKLEFAVVVFPYKGKDEWVEDSLLKIKKTLNSDKIPKSGLECEYCEYRERASEVE